MIHFIIELCLVVLIALVFANLRKFQRDASKMLAIHAHLIRGKCPFKVCVREGGYKPRRAHEYDAGIDIMSPIAVDVPAHSSAVVDTLVSVAVPNCCVGMLKSKSGLNIKHDLTGEGVVDAGYNGTIRVKLYNNGDTDYHFEKGDKLIQLVIMPCVTGEMVFVDSLEETERGDKGFGSTGK